jgi:hypothetical protein
MSQPIPGMKPACSKEKRFARKLLPTNPEEFSNMGEFPELATRHEHNQGLFANDGKPVPALSTLDATTRSSSRAISMT